jgi:hypothetical protein
MISLQQKSSPSLSSRIETTVLKRSYFHPTIRTFTFTLLYADWILVMDEGAVIEEGTHDQLIQKGGWYAEQFERQQGENMIVNHRFSDERTSKLCDDENK